MRVQHVWIPLALLCVLIWALSRGDPDGVSRVLRQDDGTAGDAPRTPQLQVPGDPDGSVPLQRGPAQPGDDSIEAPAPTPPAAAQAGFLRFRDQDSGQPAPGVSARTGAWVVNELAVYPAAQGEPWVRGDPLPSVADANGLMQLNPGTAPGALLVASGEGHGPVVLRASSSGPSGSEATEVSMPAHASLTLHFTGGVAAPPEEGWVSVLAPLSGLIRPRGARILPVMPGRALWRASLSFDGVAEWSALPSGLPLTLRLESRHEAPTHYPGELSLGPNEHRELIWNLDGGAGIEGSVTLAGTHQPGANVLLWLVKADASGERYLRIDETIQRTARSDDQGGYRLEGIQTGRWLLGPAPRATGSSGPPALGRVVEVGPQARRVRFDLVLEQPLSIDGTLEGTHEAAQVFAHCLQGRGVVSTRSDRQGAFRLQPLASGPYRLLVVPAPADQARLHFPEQTIEAGASGVTLRSRAAAKLVIRLVDGRGGEAAPAEVAVAGQTTGGYFRRWGRSSGSARVEALGLPADQYLLTAQTADGRAGQVEVQVELDQENEVELRLSPGGYLELYSALEERVLTYSVHRLGALVLRGTLSAGATRVEPLPPGTYEVREGQGATPIEALVEPGARVRLALGRAK